MNGLSHELRCLAGEKNGGVAVVFALSALALVGIGGLATEFANGNNAKAVMQSAADAAALAGARTVGAKAQRDAAAKAAFDANMVGRTTLSGVVYTPTNIEQNGSGSGYRVAASAQFSTTFSKLFGFTSLSVAVMSEATGGVGGPTDVVMVLDTTLSMDGWKMNTLKEAAKQLVDDVNAMATPSNPVRYGIVPFAEYVNIGMGNRNQPWMDVPADWSETITPSCYEEPEGGYNCTSTDYQTTCESDGVVTPCTQTKWDCTPIGPMKMVCEPPYQEKHVWKGCAGSRNYPLNVRDENYANRIPGVLDKWCGDTPMLELTTSVSTVKNVINSLVPDGDTYIPAGLIWGWRMLSPQAPLLGTAATPGSPTRKYLILMTDGLNTISPTYPEHDGWDGAEANKLTKELCANIAADKDNAIIFYTVAFNVSDPATKKILEACAVNSRGKFFDAQTAMEFKSVFKEIGSQISQLRLTR